MTELPSWIRQQRKDMGLSQAGLASQIDLPTYKVSQWERGVASPDESALQSLEKVFGSRPAGITGSDDRPTWWSEAMRLKDKMTLRELADHIGISVGMLTSEMKKAGVARRVRVTATPQVEDGGPQLAKPTRRTGSKDDQIEKLFHLLGKVPDSEVAKLADVSVRTIASYRARHGIEGYRGPRRRPAPRGRRASKLEDFRQLLGKLPDRVVAEHAGMSLGAVRNFRVKHDIPAAGRIPKSEIQRLVDEMGLSMFDEDDFDDDDTLIPSSGGSPSEDELPPEPGDVSGAAAAAVAVAKPAPKARSTAVTVAAGQRAWRITLGGDTERTLIVVASSLVAAVERAVKAGNGNDDIIENIESLGPVLAAS